MEPKTYRIDGVSHLVLCDRVIMSCCNDATATPTSKTHVLCSPKSSIVPDKLVESCSSTQSVRHWKVSCDFFSLYNSRASAKYSQTYLWKTTLKNYRTWHIFRSCWPFRTFDWKIGIGVQGRFHRIKLHVVERRVLCKKLWLKFAT